MSAGDEVLRMKQQARASTLAQKNTPVLLYVRDGRPILQSTQPFARNRTEWPCRAVLQHRLAALLSPGSIGAWAATLTDGGTFSFSDIFMEWHLQVLIGVRVRYEGKVAAFPH